MKKFDPRKMMTALLLHVNHHGIFGMGASTRQLAKLLKITYTTASKTLKSLESENKVMFIRAGRYSHWRVDFEKIEKVDGDTEFMLLTQNQEEREDNKMTDFQWASIFSMRNNCIRPTAYPNTVDDPEEKEYADNGYTIFYPE